MRSVLATCLVALLALPLASCSKDSENKSPTDPAAAEVESQAGDAALSGGDAATANAHYKAALGKDPQNPHANIGAAVTEIALLQSDPSVDSLLNLVGPAVHPRPAKAAAPVPMLARLGLISQRRLDPVTAGRAVARLIYQGLVDPSYAAWYQIVVRTHVMPRLAYAEARLNVIEGNSTFSLIVPPSISGAPADIEVDLGEVLALDAVINSVQGVLGTVVAYNFDNPTGATAEELFAPTSHFGELMPDGAARLAAAHLDLALSYTRFNAMITEIQAETDDQGDDAIPLAALSTPEFTDFADGFAQAENALATTVVVDVTDYQGNPATIDIQIAKFFDNPIADFKDKLPAHTFDIDGNPVLTDPITFPDPKFNLLFPNMDNLAWRALIGPVGTAARPM